MEKLLWPRIINRENLNFQTSEIHEDFTPWHQLPVEILIEIFKLLSKKDLYALSLVCRRFNEVISDDRELLERFTFHLNKRTVKSRWIGSRKYSKAKIMLCDFYGDFYYHQYLSWVPLSSPEPFKICLFNQFLGHPYTFNLETLRKSSTPSAFTSPISQLSTQMSP